MRNLANVENVIANLQVSYELAEAGLLAYRIIWRRELEVKANIIGLLSCPMGTAVWTRGPIYFVVRLSNRLGLDLSEDLSKETGSQSIRRSSDTEFYIDDLDGVKKLAHFLCHYWGGSPQRIAVERTLPESVWDFAESSLPWAYRNYTFVPGPDSKVALAVLQIQALLIMGGRKDDRAYGFREALRVAVDTFGSESEHAIAIRKDLANALRTETRALREICKNISSINPSSIFDWSWRLERVLTERSGYLSKLGRHHEAFRLGLEVDALREHLIELAKIQINHDEILVRRGKGSLQDAQAPHDRYQLAMMKWHLANLQQKRGKKAKRLFAQAEEAARKLNETYSRAYQQGIERMKDPLIL